MFVKIKFLYFLLAFSFGLLLCYVMTPMPEVVLKFPTPFNAGRVVYRDKADTCYVYRADAVSCPMDKHRIKPQPVQEDFRTRMTKENSGI
jgi:hypothetical protein